MSWMTEIADPTALRARTLKSLSVPMGLANPLWLAFGAAASAGAAWWLMTRWATPLNVEAMFRGAPATGPRETAPESTVLRTPETTPVLLEVALEVAPAFVEAAEAPLETALELAEAETDAIAQVVSEALAEVQVEPETKAETEAQAETEARPEAEVRAERAADDLTLLVGVGPRSAAALAERGVATFADLAAWTEEQMAAFDAELKLKGRSVRDAWRAQARRLAAEG